MLQNDVMVFPLGKSLPTVPFIHLHLVVRDELSGALLVSVAGVGPNRGTDELVAPEEEVVALSISIACTSHTDVLHQSKVANLGGGEGRSMEGEREKDGMSVGGENKGTGEMEGRGGEKGERLQMNVLRQVVTSVTTSLYSHYIRSLLHLLNTLYCAGQQTSTRYATSHSMANNTHTYILELKNGQ